MLYAPKVRQEILEMPSAAIRAQIARDDAGSCEAESAEQDRVGVILEDMRAAVEDFEIALQRLEIAGD